MNILMVNPKLCVGGAEKIMLYLVRGFKERGDRVYVAADRGGFEEDFEEAGAQVIRLPLDQDKKRIFTFIGLVFRLRRICKEERIDVIHSHHRWTTFLAAFAAKTLRLHLVCHCHSKIQGKKRLTWMGDRIIAVSDDIRQHLMENFGIREDRIHTIRNSVPEPFVTEEEVEKEREELRRNFKVDFDGPVVGTIGRLIADKGFDVFISSLPHILEEYPECRFLIIGKGEEERELKELAVGKGVAGRTFFLGEKRFSLPFLKLMDVFVLHSYTEGIPVSVLEAMSLGRPVVVTSVGGVPEVVSHGVSGLLVEPGDPVVLAENVLSLLKDRSLAERLGLKGKEVVRNGFRADQMVEEVRDLFAGLIASSGRKAAKTGDERSHGS